MAQTQQPTQRRRRDPAQRRQVIIDAAAELIVELGSAGLTHRLVADRAGVPLGSTTQYFTSLDELREAALYHLADEIDGEVRDFAGVLRERGASADVFGEMLHAYLCDIRLVRADLALLNAAFVDPALGPLALRWPTAVIDLLIPHIGEQRARAVAAYVDGVAMHTVLRGTTPTIAELSDALAALTNSGEADAVTDN